MFYEAEDEEFVFSYTFDHDIELCGHMKLKLWVSTDLGSDIDLFVSIQKLNQNGDEIQFYIKTGYTKEPVAMGWLRVSERALDSLKSTPWQLYLSRNNPKN